jgi:hypothetical protein
MSKITQALIQCPHCDGIAEYNVYVSANVTIDPSLKHKVLDGSLSWKTCEKCGLGFNAAHDLLYHDMDKKFCVWLKYENEYGEIELEPLAKQADKVFTKHRLRIVFSRDELIEKIKLAEESYDDIFIETVKLFHSIKNEIDIISPFFYERTETKRGCNMVVFIHKPDDAEPTRHRLEINDAENTVGPFVPQITSALTSEWAPWMWVNRESILQAMKASGLIEPPTETYRVHVLNPSGYRVEEWVIDDEKDREHFRDKASGDFYAVSYFEKGEPVTCFVSKEYWEKARLRLEQV